ncbi:MAG: hypothetical protein MRY78_12625 [Saprospiraceae bacterium]|nr:hypothetical protein [Saprospiraceae bacterium]
MKNNSILFLCLLLLSSLLITSCSDDEESMEPNGNGPGVDLANAMVSVSFMGDNFSFEGFGGATVVDTSLVYATSIGLDTLDSNTLLISAATFFNGANSFDDQTFTTWVANYTGPGTYKMMREGAEENGGIYLAGYFDKVSFSEEFSLFCNYGQDLDPESQIRIIVDNDDRFEATFNMEVMNSETGEPSGNYMQGEITIEKR